MVITLRVYQKKKPPFYNYLNHHKSTEDIELYFCGPPLMNQAVQKMGEDFGIPDEHIKFHDFGGLGIITIWQVVSFRT